MARFFAFFTLFHLSLTFFQPEVPFNRLPVPATVLRTKKYSVARHRFHVEKGLTLCCDFYTFRSCSDQACYRSEKQ